MKFTKDQIIRAAREVNISESSIEELMKKLCIESGEDKDYTPLENFGLSRRTISTLARRNIITVKDLKEFVDLYGSTSLKTKIRNFGDVCYEELKRTFSWIEDFE